MIFVYTRKTKILPICVLAKIIILKLISDKISKTKYDY